MAETAIDIRNVNKTFAGKKAVDDVSFQVEAETCFGFLGPNGAGKTTLMKMLYNRAVRDDRGGTMNVFGFDPAKQELCIKHLSGVVPQEDSLDEELDVVQNLRVYAQFHSMDSKRAEGRIKELLEFIELADRAKAKIRELSGGMKRRLVLARALINQPRLLILDEPTTGLDPQVRHLIWDMIRRLKRQGATILLTTHYMEEAFQLCDRLVIMDKGRVVLEGVPQDLVEETVERYALESYELGADDTCAQAPLPSSVRVESSQQSTRLFSDEMDDLKTAAEILGLGRFHLRQSNLEDVFLRTTGRSLNAQQ